MITVPRFRVFFHSNLQDKNVLLPVHSLTTEYHGKNDIRVFVSVLEQGKRGPQTTFRVNSKAVSPCILMRRSSILDRYGKPIFSGDVLQFSTKEEPDYERSIVYYHNKVFSASYYSRVPPDRVDGYTNAWWGEGWEPNLENLLRYTVKKDKSKQRQRIHLHNIGNICENPELIGYEKKDFNGINTIYKLGHTGEEQNEAF